MLRRLALPLSSLAASSAAQAAPPTPDALERTLVGAWQGALDYRDYQSNHRLQLPMQTTVQLGADGATVIRSASFRKGRAVQLMTEDAQVPRHAGAEDWTVVYTRRGPDGGAPADIRITQTRLGAKLTNVKEVKRPDEPDSAFAFRNQTVLVRQP